MNKIFAIIEKEHFLYSTISKLELNLLDAEDEDLLSENLLDLPKQAVVFDFSIAGNDEKRALFDQLEESGANVYADCTTLWGDAFVEQYRCLKGAFAFGLPSPKNRYEAWAKKPQDKILMNNLFESSGIDLHFVDSPGIGFTFPRIMVQIINEGFFALGDQMASTEAMNAAMKAGAGHPLGPFEWIKSPVSLRACLFLLDELLAVTGEPRYRASLELRREFLKLN
jgi:hypothetical protein